MSTSRLRYARLFSLPYPISEILRYTTEGPIAGLFDECSTVADLYDAVGVLREGVTRRGSRFKVTKIGPGRYNEIIDWLELCGYPVEGLRIEQRARSRRRRQTTTKEAAMTPEERDRQYGHLYGRMTKEQMDRLYGHLSDAEIAAEITRLRTEGDDDIRHADELDRLADRMEAGGYQTVGELIEAQKKAQ
jgi:hypothetical protein